MRISKNAVIFHPDSGEVEAYFQQNPVPKHALEAARKAGMPSSARPDPYFAVGKAGVGVYEGQPPGVGVIDYSAVLAATPAEIKAFNLKHEIKEYLAGNTKTEKPRPSGLHGVISGLSLAPHFYPNLLHKMVTPRDKLKDFSKESFNKFDGSTGSTAAQEADVPVADLLDFCVGSSKSCRETCLVYAGQNTATKEAPRSKMKHTWAFLNDPVLFVAGLRKAILAKAKTAARNGTEAVVRLNMLSDIPWYIASPELLEECAAAGVAFYDYTKIPFWDNPHYQHVEHCLDLTFSFSGANEALCAEALRHDVRIATCFAPADPNRPASVAYRTSWQELLYSVSLGDPADPQIELFDGVWPLVDGDESDYRMDDPAPAIVALNFKQPTLTEAKYPGIEARVASARSRFAMAVPDAQGLGFQHARARARDKKRWKAVDEDTLYDMSLPDVLGLGEQFKAEKKLQKNPLQVLEEGSGEAEAARTPIVMEELTDAHGSVVALIGPHVPTVLND
jgi:hypothetical protein